MAAFYCYIDKNCDKINNVEKMSWLTVCIDLKTFEEMSMKKI